jgi:glutamate racemase
MDTRPVLFLDSGIGGLPYCAHFLARNPQERVIYVADRDHFPYGPKDRETLTALLTSLIQELLTYVSPKLAVVACNAASVSSLEALRRRFSGLPWVGTVPAVKPALMESRTRRIGVLGAERTVADPYIRRLADRYGADCGLSLLAAPDLVELVEYGFPARFGLSSVTPELCQRITPYIEEFRRQGADGIVLGCTHFLFLRDAFKAAAKPDIQIYHSVEGVSRRAEALLDQPGLRAGGEAQGPGILLVTGTGPLEPAWHDRGACFNLRVLPWEALQSPGVLWEQGL